MPDGDVSRETFSCPLEALAGEIEFAIQYATACHPGILLDRRDLAAQVAAMLTERAVNGLSGMSLGDSCESPDSGRNLVT